MGVRHMQGVPWHIEYLKKSEKENTGRRSKSACVFYNKKGQDCRMLGDVCYGVTHCSSYSENIKALKRICPVGSDGWNAIEFMEYVSKIAKAVQIEIDVLKTDSNKWHSKRIADRLSELLSQYQFEGLHAESKDTRYLAVSMMHRLKRNKAFEVNGETLLPYILDVVWLKLNGWNYYSVNICSHMSQSQKDYEDVHDLLECSSARDVILKHKPTKHLIEYSTALCSGKTSESLIRLYARILP